MVDKSIAYRLSFLVSIAVIVVFVIFIVVYFLVNQRLLRQNVENKVTGLSSEVSSVITREVISIGEVTSILAGQVYYYHMNRNVEELLDDVVEKFPFLVAVTVHLDSTLTDPPYYYSLVQHSGGKVFSQLQQPVFAGKTEEEVFQMAARTKSSGWTTPYICSNKEATATYIHPIYRNTDGEKLIIGHISSNFSLRELNAAINRINTGMEGYAFLIDEHGNYLTHPDEKKIFRANLFSVPDKVMNRKNRQIQKIVQEGVKGSAIAYPELLNFEKSRAYFSPMPETKWYLVFTMPYKELYHELFVVTFKMLLIALAGIIIIYFLVSYIIRKQIRPLSHVTSKLSSFSSPFALNTENEVKQVANSLQYLKVWFEQYQIAREKEEKNNFQHKRDLMQASEIQQSLIKNSFPAFPNRTDIDLHALYKPARTVSGDLFDYYFIDENNLIFTIGDVSGKGIPAAIFMSVCLTVIKKNSHLRHPKKIVERTNTELCGSNHNQYFLTLFLGILNVKTGILTYCNAAHTFPFILSPEGKFRELTSTHGLPLGLYPDKVYGAEQVRMDAGDTILMYTDGVYDALNEINIASGNIWIQKSLSRVTRFEPKEIVELLEQDLAEAESSPKDDVCLFAIKYKP